MPYEEVVIDGDTSSDEEKKREEETVEEEDEEDAVLVVTPQSRKRRRRSAIMDEEDEGEAEERTAGGPHARRSLTESKRQETKEKKEEEDEEKQDDDDEVEIIQVSTPSSTESKRRKTKRLAILDSDEEIEMSGAEGPHAVPLAAAPAAGQSVVNKLQVEPVHRLPVARNGPLSATAQTPVADRACESSSTGRRSSRIERKRQKKAETGPSVRKLEFLSLDNCLYHTEKPRRTSAEDDDEDEFIVDEDEEEEEDGEKLERRAAAERKRRRTSTSSRTRSPPSRRFADGDEDLDEFIVNDDEVEYMDDDEEGVMDEHLSSADEVDDGDGDEMLAVMQSREPSEWFGIYLRYLEESILDDDLDNKMRFVKRNPEYALFQQASHHIERAICSRRDTFRSSVVWNDDIMEHLRCATRFHSLRCTATIDCQACRRANHFATQLVQFGGFACDATELYKPNWMKKLRAAVRELEPMQASFELGTVCHARTLGFWQLLHAKHFWVALVDAKRRENGDGHGRIDDSVRAAFYKSEYGRYKRLLDLVDKSSTEATKSVTFMPNVWKKVTAQRVHSEFLPSPGLKGLEDGAPRRGTMDSLVSESDDDEQAVDEEEEEEEEDEEEEEEKGSEDKQPAPRRRGNNPPLADAEQEEEEEVTQDAPAKTNSRKRMRQSTIFSAINGTASSRSSSPHAPDRVKHETNGKASETKDMATAIKRVDEIDAEDLLCLVCRQNQRDGAIVHGHYLHFYCCFRCAKRQQAAGHGCMVCDRPIDSVLRILPLSKEARKDILAQQEAT